MTTKGYTLTLNPNAVIKDGKVYIQTTSELAIEGVIYKQNPSAFKNAKGNVYSLVTNALENK